MVSSLWRMEYPYIFPEALKNVKVVKIILKTSFSYLMWYKAQIRTLA